MDREQVLATISERLQKSWTYKVGADMAHDIAQDTWIALKTSYSHIEDETELLKLAFGISRYISLRMKTKAGRELPPPEEWNPMDSGPNSDDQALSAQLREAIRQLTGRCPEVLLKQLEGYTADEIKSMMGAPRTDTVYVWIHRCIESLRKKMGSAEGRK